MATEILTKEDLEEFKWELLSDIKAYLDKREGKKGTSEPEIIWLKSHHVQRMLQISPGTLQNLRVNGTIPYSKIGGVLFYKKTDIEQILESNMHNADQSNLLSKD